ncbi:hypothetical protein BDV38DRAFT_282389 [Aspergillus pseudotamarii]|uniref:AMP-activated protein kinase glycogen-binding domain-containing protein n=1 Tax=Aspergillus pseudotamarii TaxID=132259 RepID=A0A5N6SWH6_ASPPS|nr:uncharacterized protein BDV38DRAFT_282389 [Aspergillus pseudotamarii]KAE8138090.1 hypothetical protein BDV38DRAFT_282389 [Aspergillus pseudotamarii]
MGSYTFRWPHHANEVFVTGTFDDWGKTVRLDRKGDVFEKEVPLPATEKLHYKFVVDGIWTTDHSVPEEDDGNHNINNVLYPDQIRKEDTTSSLQNGIAVMAGVAPDSTTAALAAEVPKESRRDILGDAALSSTAPGSTTAELAKHASLEQRANVPGSFPATPRSEVEQFSVNPIPASSGTGNPIKLKPGEKVPDPSTFNANTIHSTARTDQAGYEQDASHPLTGGQSNKDTSAFAVPPISNNMIPESSLPMGQASEGSSDPVTIQSAAPTSTTAALAGAVPLESHKKQTVGGPGAPVGDVPEMVRHSMSEAHADPEAAAIQEAVGEKKEMEHELQQKVPVDESRGTPAPTTGVTAATTETAPQATISQPDSAQLSPRATTPTTRPDTTSEAGPTVTTGPETTKTSEVSGPGSGSAAATAGDTGASATKTAEPTHQDTGVGATKARSSTPPKDTERKDSGSSSGTPSQKKKRNRASAFFHKLKEKLT